MLLQHSTEKECFKKFEGPANVKILLDKDNKSYIGLSEKFHASKTTKDEINKAYIKIQKRIHPDISPETARLSAIVNEAKEVVLKNIS